MCQTGKSVVEAGAYRVGVLLLDIRLRVVVAHGNGHDVLERFLHLGEVGFSERHGIVVELVSQDCVCQPNVPSEEMR